MPRDIPGVGGIMRLAKKSKLKYSPGKTVLIFADIMICRHYDLQTL
jgi:hypothetical protein